MEVFPGISMDPKVRFGKPCIAGTRIDVVTVLGGLASGISIDDLVSEYQLTHEQISAVLRFAAEAVRRCELALRNGVPILPNKSGAQLVTPEIVGRLRDEP